MGLFTRRPKEAPEMVTSSGNADDDALLQQIAAHSKQRSRPRHWVHYLYCGDEVAARLAAVDIKGAGWAIKRVDEAAKGPGWVVIAERHRAVISASTVRDARAFFETVAARVPGGEYDGWEASI